MTCIWDAPTERPLAEPLRYEGGASAAQFNRDGLRVVTVSNRTVRIWDASTGKVLTEPLQHERTVSTAKFSQDGLRVITTLDDNTECVWDFKTGKQLALTFLHDHVHALSVQFSPDGLRVMVVGMGEKYTRIWNSQTGLPLTEPLWHEGYVQSTRFSADGLRVVTASWDKTVRVWDARTGQPLSETLRHEAQLSSAEFSPDGQWMVTASTNIARVWEMPDASMPAPSWLPELAVVVGGKRLTGASVLKPVAESEYLKLKGQWNRSYPTNHYSRWAKWFFSDRATRAISPLSSITVPAYVHHQIQQNTLTSLQEAVRLAPTNGLAFARLAKQVLAQSDNDNPRRVGEADFFSRYALKWSPGDAEVKKIRAEIAAQIETVKKP